MVAIPIHVDFGVKSKICVKPDDGSGMGLTPVMSMACNIMIPVAALVEALAQFQKKHEDAEQYQKAPPGPAPSVYRVKSILPDMPVAGSMQSQRPPDNDSVAQAAVLQHESTAEGHMPVQGAGHEPAHDIPDLLASDSVPSQHLPDDDNVAQTDMAARARGRVPAKDAGHHPAHDAGPTWLERAKAFTWDTDVREVAITRQSYEERHILENYTLRTKWQAPSHPTRWIMEDEGCLVGFPLGTAPSCPPPRRHTQSTRNEVVFGPPQKPRPQNWNAWNTTDGSKETPSGTHPVCRQQ